MSLTIGSLFSGIGGLELGLERAGLGPVLWQCEINSFCRRVLAKHWPNVRRFDDVTRPRDYSYVDVICGGFPCQDISSQGKRRGLGGEKSSLWWHYADVIRRVRPRFVVVENVAHGKDHWLPYVRHQLHLLSYRTRALGIAARDVGAPHGRPRIFVVGHSDRDRESAGTINGEATVVSTHARALRDGWPPPPARLRMADGVRRGLDGHRIRALGNAVVPQCAEIVGRVIMATLTKGDPHGR